MLFLPSIFIWTSSYTHSCSQILDLLKFTSATRSQNYTKDYVIIHFNSIFYQNLQTLGYFLSYPFLSNMDTEVSHLSHSTLFIISLNPSFSFSFQLFQILLDSLCDCKLNESRKARWFFFFYDIKVVLSAWLLRKFSFSVTSVWIRHQCLAKAWFHCVLFCHRSSYSEPFNNSIGSDK